MGFIPISLACTIIAVTPFRCFPLRGRNVISVTIRCSETYTRREYLTRSYPNKRIFVSEFGFSDAADGRRPYWILKTSWHILQAIKEGIPVDAVLIWTLVNNFEWNYGMSQKFGLFEEGELRTPLSTRSDKIRSWQAWTTAARALRS